MFIFGAMNIMNIWRVALVWVICSLWAVEVTAQELTPRLYWPSPKGTRVLVTGYSYITGGVIFDRTIPISEANSRINSSILAYLQTIELWGRSSNLMVELPYAWGHTKGLLAGEPARRDFAAFGDLGFTLTVNLLGAPSMTLEDFLELRANPHPIIGASLKVVAPTGNYDEDRLINVGANRWAARAQLGSIIPLKPTWLLELSASAWFFGDDNDFLPGKRVQNPIFAGQFNIIKRFRPGFWGSLDFSFFGGGRQTIGGGALSDTQRNLKVGGTLVIPFKRRHAIKIGYANGVVTRYGSDFDQFLLTYQVLFN